MLNGENLARSKNKLIYKGSPVRIIDDYPSKTMEAKKKWDTCFKVLKNNVNQEFYIDQNYVA